MYIVFEGVNGVGKSTLIPKVIDRLNELFEDAGKNVLINYFHEGDSVNNEYEYLTFECIRKVLDYARDRAGLQRLIQPSYSKNITIGDRSYYSSLVYQGDTVEPSYIREVNSFATEPDMIFLLCHQPSNLPKYKHALQNRYLNYVPYGKTMLIFTDLKTIEETVEDISQEILIAWVKMFDDWKKTFGED